MTGAERELGQGRGVLCRVHWSEAETLDLAPGLRTLPAEKMGLPAVVVRVLLALALPLAFASDRLRL